MVLLKDCKFYVFYMIIFNLQIYENKPKKDAFSINNLILSYPNSSFWSRPTFPPL